MSSSNEVNLTPSLDAEGRQNMKDNESSFKPDMNFFYSSSLHDDEDFGLLQSEDESQFVDEFSHRSFIPNLLPCTESTSGKWSHLPGMHSARWRFAYATLNGRIYCFGGLSKCRRLKSAEMYCPERNTWIKLPDMTHTRSGAACVVAGEKIYVLGGTIATDYRSKSVEIFDTATLVWEQLPSDMQYVKERHSAVLVGRKIYVLGGRRSVKAECYDLDTEQWSDIASMTINRYSYDAVALNGKIYAVGGMREIPKRKNEECYTECNMYHRFLSSVEVYDISKNEWSLVDAKMKNRRYGCSIISVGAKILVFGGWDDTEFVSAIETFDTQTNEWTGSHIPPPDVQRAEFAAVSRQNDIVLFGGNYGTAKSGCKKCTDTPVEVFHNALTYLSRAHSTPDFPIPESNMKSNINAEKERIGVIRGQKKIKVDSDLNKNQIRKSARINSSSASKYLSCRVAKEFDKVAYYGTVIAYDEEVKFWKVEYEDGDKEEYEEDELLKLISLYKQGTHGINNTDRSDVMKEVVTDDHKDECSIKKKELKKLDAGIKIKIADGTSKMTFFSGLSKLGSIKNVIEAKKREISRVEKEIFGKMQNGSLQDRSQKIKLHELIELEKEVYGEIQTGEFHERVEKLEKAIDEGFL